MESEGKTGFSPTEAIEAAAIVNKFKFYSKVGGAFAMAVGAVVLVGWAINNEPLKAVVPGLVAMKANTALALLVSGAVLWLVSAGPENHAARVLSTIGAVFVLLIGLLTLVEYIFTFNLGIDQILFKEPPGAAGTFLAPGRPAPPTALCFFLLGLAFLTIDTETARQRRPSQ